MDKTIKFYKNKRSLGSPHGELTKSSPVSVIEMVEFTIADLPHNNVCIYLQGDREEFIKRSLEIEDDYVWDEYHRVYLDYWIKVTKYDKFFRVFECSSDECYEVEEELLTPEQVIKLVNKLCNGREIEKII